MVPGLESIQGCRYRFRAPWFDDPIMNERIMEIRRRAQQPVSHYNDIAGRLVGDRLSIHLTRVFLALGISPTVATISMLLFGIAGSFLIPFGGLYSVAGFACVFSYYLCDCVDGEVARFNGVERLVWGFHDFLFHLYVKSAFFLALGALIVRVSDEPWMFLFGISGLLATLLIKFLADVGVAVTCRQILMRPRDEHQTQLDGLMSEGADESSVSDAPDRKRSHLGTLRAILTNFDLASLLFLIVAVCDLWLAQFELMGMNWNLTTLLAVAYGVVLPLDFADRMQTAIRRDEFGQKSRELLRCADEFRLDA